MFFHSPVRAACSWCVRVWWCVGHRTFSSSVLVCDILGHVCHAPLLVPFHGWRVSHRKHHENHNHVDNDHSWRPVPKSSYVQYEGIAKIMRFSHALLVLYPFYLLTDSEFTSGNHFNPPSRLFRDDERVGAAISTGCVVAWLTFLFATFPLATLLDAYFVPYIFFVVWLDLVTYLQHTDPTLTYYRDSAWSFLKGGLNTMDRSYGRLIDHLHHDIGTHVIHHLFFTKIPHYHLLEATEALKPILGDYLRVDDTPIVQAYLNTQSSCHFIPDQGNVIMSVPAFSLRASARVRPDGAWMGVCVCAHGESSHRWRYAHCISFPLLFSFCFLSLFAGTSRRTPSRPLTTRSRSKVVKNQTM